MADPTLVAQFNQFDDKVLRKLIIIGQSILSPLDTELTSVDFAVMIDQVFKPGGLRDRYWPTWTDGSKSDFGRLLVELFAVFSDKDMHYINHFSKEGFGGVAELYRSLFHKAYHDGHNPPSNRAAIGNVQLTFAPGGAEFVPRGTIKIGIRGIAKAIYTNDEFTLPLSAISGVVTVQFRHGELTQEQGTFDGWSIRLSNPNMIVESEVLTIDGEEWERVTSFLPYTAADKVYQIVYDEDGAGEIFFAKDNMGAVPSTDAIWQCEYLKGGGYVGDISAGVVNQIITSGTVRNLTSFDQFAFSGGAIQLSLEKLRQTIIGNKRAQDRAVTPDDALVFVNQLEWVLKSGAEAVLGFLYVYIYPTGGGDISPSQKALVEALLDPRTIRMMGFELTVASSLRVRVTLDMTIYLGPKVIRSGAMTLAQQTIQQYLDPAQNGDFGVGVNRSQLDSQLRNNIPGYTNCVFNELHRTGSYAPPADLEFIPQEVVDYAGSTISIILVGGI